METVNFQCGHCGKLLAVQRQHLGQQVRCPSCQQIVVAPTAVPAPAPAPPLPAYDPVPQIRAPEDMDSIFSSPGTESDDLFGSAPAPPIDFRPPETAAAAPPGFPGLELRSDQAPLDERPPDPPADPFAYAPSAPAAPPDPVPAPAQPTPDWVSSAAQPWSPISDSPGDDLAAALPRPRPRDRGGWHIAVFIIPLISYAVLATIAVAILYYQKQATQLVAPPHPLEFLPDIEGDNPIKSKPSSSMRVPRTPPDARVPDHLVIRLGERLTLGEVEVRPYRIEKTEIEVRELGEDGATKPEGQALKLYLKIKNVSEGRSFYPMDRYFTRFWSGKQETRETRYRGAGAPFTQLVINDRRFYGGPAGYFDRRLRNDKGWVNEEVLGQKYDTLLKPGQELSTFVCTDPRDDDLQKALEDLTDKTLLWQVQVRRGAVDVNGRLKPATAVFAVSFTAEDVGQ